MKRLREWLFGADRCLVAEASRHIARAVGEVQAEAVKTQRAALDLVEVSARSTRTISEAQARLERNTDGRPRQAAPL